jgi:hypothetical protein
LASEGKKKRASMADANRAEKMDTATVAPPFGLQPASAPPRGLSKDAASQQRNTGAKIDAGAEESKRKREEQAARKRGDKIVSDAVNEMRRREQERAGLLGPRIYADQAEVIRRQEQKRDVIQAVVDLARAREAQRAADLTPGIVAAQKLYSD